MLQLMDRLGGTSRSFPEFDSYYFLHLIVDLSPFRQVLGQIDIRIGCFHFDCRIAAAAGARRRPERLVGGPTNQRSRSLRLGRR